MYLYISITRNALTILYLQQRLSDYYQIVLASSKTQMKSFHLRRFKQQQVTEKRNESLIF